MRIMIPIVIALASCGSVSTGTGRDPLLVGAAVPSPGVLAVVPGIRGADRHRLDCRGLSEPGAEMEMCTLLVACALPPDGILDANGNTFLGEAGLAPSWPDAGIQPDERREVSACVLAHLSQDGLFTVPSLRGRRLAVDPAELADWPVEEGAFFGDLMADHPVAAACRGVGDASAGGLQDRVCAKPDPDHPGLTLCGLAFAGECLRVCERRNGTYRECRISHHEFDPVITTFVQP